MGVYVSHHAELRLKERVGLSKKIADSVAQKALERGIKHCETSGQLKKYLDKLYLSHGNGNNMRVYNNKIYIFQDVNLITILNLPNNLLKVANKINRKKKEQKLS